MWGLKERNGGVLIIDERENERYALRMNIWIDIDIKKKEQLLIWEEVLIGIE